MILKSHDQKQLDRTRSSERFWSSSEMEFVPMHPFIRARGWRVSARWQRVSGGCQAEACGGCPAVTFDRRHLGLGSTYGGQQVAYERPRFVVGRAARREWSAQRASRACSGCQQKSGRRSEGLQLSHRYPANDGSVETGTEAYEGAAPMRSIYEPPAAGEPAGQPPYSSGPGADDPYRRDSAEDQPRRDGGHDPYGGGGNQGAGGYGGPYGQGPYGQGPGQETYGQSPYGQGPYGQGPYGQGPYSQGPYGQGPYGYGGPAGPGGPYGYGYGGGGPQGPRSPVRRFRRGAAIVAVALAAGFGTFFALGGGGSGTGPTLTTSQIAAQVDPALVDVTSTLGYQQAESLGTGLVLTSNGEILTNNHVIEGATSIKVTDIGNGKSYQAKVVGYKQTKDIAVIQLQKASGLTIASLGNSSSVQTG